MTARIRWFPTARAHSLVFTNQLARLGRLYCSIVELESCILHAPVRYSQRFHMGYEGVSQVMYVVGKALSGPRRSYDNIGLTNHRTFYTGVVNHAMQLGACSI